MDTTATETKVDTTATAELSNLRSKLTEDDMKVDDYCLNRFLRARKNDVDKAYAHFLEWQRFYRGNDLANILSRVPPKLQLVQQVLPNVECGFSKKGYPVHYQRMGEFNAQAAFALLNPTELASYHCYRRKQQQLILAEQSAKLGRNVDRIVCVLDMAGLSFQALTAKELFELTFRLDERFYPESVEQIFVVNAGKIFPVVFKGASGWVLDPVLKAKIVVCTPANQKETLLQCIDEDQLLSDYGGKNTEPFAHAEPAKVMQEMKSRAEAKRKELQLSYVIIKAGASHQVTLPVKKGMCQWYMKLADKDINFSADFVADGESSRKIHPVRCNSHEGSFVVSKTGVCTFTFDNSDSLFTSKTVGYHLAVIEEMEAVGAQS